MWKFNSAIRVLILLIFLGFYIYEITILTEFIRTTHKDLTPEAIAAIYGVMVMFASGLKYILEKVITYE